MVIKKFDKNNIFPLEASSSLILTEIFTHKKPVMIIQKTTLMTTALVFISERMFLLALYTDKTLFKISKGGLYCKYCYKRKNQAPNI